jgi:hypothetical protein
LASAGTRTSARNYANVAFHNIVPAALSVELLVAVTYLNQAATIVSPFTIIDVEVGFDVVFGSQWQSWCQQKKGQHHPSFFSPWFFSPVVVPCF